MNAGYKLSPNQAPVNDNDVFLLRHGTAEDKHVSVEELQSKLCHFKQQLNLVKALYNSQEEAKLIGALEPSRLCSQNGHATSSNESTKGCTYIQNDLNNSNNNNNLNCHKEINNIYADNHLKTNGAKSCAEVQLAKTDCNIAISQNAETNRSLHKHSERTSSNDSNSYNNKPLKQNKLRRENSKIPRIVPSTLKKDQHTENQKTNLKPGHQNKVTSFKKFGNTSAGDDSVSESEIQSSETECDGNLKLRRKGKTKSSNIRSRHSVEIERLRNLYEEKFQEFQQELNEKSSIKELSLTTKLKYFETLNLELQEKCNQFELQCQYLQDETKVLRTNNTNMNENIEKLSSEKTQIKDEYEKLRKERKEIETELFKSQQMLNNSFRIRTEAEEYLLEIQKKQGNLISDLHESEKQNEVLQREIASLKKMCLENDENIKYHQQVEEELKQCLDKAIQQVTQLEQQTREKEIENNLAFEKLVEEHEVLFQEHKTIKVLYAESIKRIEESMKEIDHLKSTVKTQTEENEILLKDNEVLRQINQSPVQDGWRKDKRMSLRKTWFSYHPLDQQFPNPHTEGYESERIYRRNNSIDNTSKTERTKIPRRAHTFHNDRQKPNLNGFHRTDSRSLDRTHSLSRSVSRSQSSASLRSRGSSVCRSSQSLYSTDYDSFESDSTLESEVSLDFEVETFSRRKKFTSSSPFSPKLNGGKKRDQEPAKCQSWYIPISPVPNVIHEEEHKENQIENQVENQVEEGSFASKIPSFNRNSGFRQNIKSKNQTNLLKPSNQAVTTDEVLATVKQGKLETAQKTKIFTRNPITSRLERLNKTYGKDGGTILKLEDQLKSLNQEKIKLDSQLGKIPTKTSGRLTRQLAEKEEKIHSRLEIVTKKIGSVRLELRKLKTPAKS